MKCEKTSFSKRNINTALRAMLKKGKRMRAYVCDKCKEYHMTSDIK